MAFAYLGKIGFDDNTPQSLDIENQNKVFDINFMQMKEALNTSINFLKKKVARLYIYLLQQLIRLGLRIYHMGCPKNILMN